MAISHASDRVGQVLGGRYRLLGPIGTGASATVYLADDVVLRRRVAVKVLHAALADDAAFLKRFRAEAQAAAALNHPHVMAVHDWGQGDVPYLVTELLGGGSLRALLDLGHRLDVAQARQIGLEAARGLDYAHRRGFVHRDIKPANLLFDDEGRLRIADFGLARALAEAAWTEPTGAVLGTARYASPEQAQGRPLDGRSDVYSLALVLIEAVTGDVPFTADTTLGTLMARVDRPLPVPDELGPLVIALTAAGNPDPAARPDAAGFANLLMAAGDLGPVAPLPLAGTATIDGADLEPREPTTLYVPERLLRADLDPEIMAAPPGTTTNGLSIVHEGVAQPATVRVDRADAVEAEAVSRAEKRRRRKEAKDAAGAGLLGAAATVSPIPGGGAPVEPEQLPYDRSDRPRDLKKLRRRLLAVLVVLLLAVGVGAGAWYLTRTPTHELVSLVGEPIDTALVQLSSNGLNVDRTDVYDEAQPAGTVLSQDPPPGTELKEGSTVALTVSLGPPPVGVPDPGGKALSQVTQEFAALGLKVGDIKRVYDENWIQDTVLSTAPGTPAQVPKGSSVGLIVSDGPAPRTVPDGLVGGTYDAAAAAIKAAGLKPVRNDVFNDTVPVGQVMDVNPKGASQAARDSNVTVTVSKGPELVPIPATIKGVSPQQAAQILQGLGLSVTGIQGSPLAPVTNSNPAIGTPVKKGTTVVLITQ